MPSYYPPRKKIVRIYIHRSATGPVSDIFHLEASDTPAAAAAAAATTGAAATAPATVAAPVAAPTLLRQQRRARFPSRERAVLLDFVPAATMPLARDSSAAHAHASGTESSAPSTPIGGGGGGRYRRASSSSSSRRLDSFRPVRAASGLQNLLRHGDSGGGGGGARRLGSGGTWGGGGGGAPGEGLLGVPAQVVGGESMPFWHLIGTGGSATAEWDAFGMGSSGGIERSLQQRQQYYPRHGGGAGINPYLARRVFFVVVANVCLRENARGRRAKDAQQTGKEE